MKVFLSPLAERKLMLLLDYLTENWSLGVKDEFLNELKRSFKQIELHPKSCQESTSIPNLYRCVVTRQTSIYYRINTEDIEIVTVIDNRQNPSNIIDEFKV
jgi:plasmid stabilization system protein ParE